MGTNSNTVHMAQNMAKVLQPMTLIYKLAKPLNIKKNKICKICKINFFLLKISTFLTYQQQIFSNLKNQKCFTSFL